MNTIFGLGLFVLLTLLVFKATEFERRLVRGEPKLNTFVIFGLTATGMFLWLVVSIGLREICLETAEGVICTSKYEEFIAGTPNEVGDTLAGVASTLALIWFLVTVSIQLNELGQQRKEFQTMNSHLQEQNFDSFFFGLVSSYNSIVNSMDIRRSEGGREIYTGRDCFKFFYSALNLEPSERAYPELSVDNTKKKFERMFAQHSADLAHYFRFVYNAMRVVNESDASDKRHRRMLRALLSDDELLIIFYNCLSEKGCEMIRYAEIFELFDNLPRERLIYKRHWDDYFGLVSKLPTGDAGWEFNPV
ncbi:putative phage abortive infection protein [Arenibacterium halophilum]|uniref:Phage abortive infection protein n=1 Tax=Arenibacterium halophilum TaxID=2583821 RepID=A0ABY2XGN7_9RHOB|nr:putative phage abortive infection protein [Arenibacterium halophilum]TMV15628.1 hypothetical protein FGK64_06665 [Arenibacterium halophilum]